MKKIFSLFVLMLLFTTSVSAQNWYGKVGLGFDVSLSDGMNTNQTINGYVGYFFDGLYLGTEILLAYLFLQSGPAAVG